MFGQRGEQLKLGHGQGVAGIRDPGAAAQGTAQPGDCLGQAVRSQASLSAASVAGSPGAHRLPPAGPGAPCPALVPGQSPAHAIASATAANTAIDNPSPRRGAPRLHRHAGPASRRPRAARRRSLGSCSPSRLPPQGPVTGVPWFRRRPPELQMPGQRRCTDTSQRAAAACQPPPAGNRAAPATAHPRPIGVPRWRRSAGRLSAGMQPRGVNRVPVDVPGNRVGGHSGRCADRT
jgi:hypothetical protein